MAGDSGKENIAEGLFAYPTLRAPLTSPAKKSRKTRSKSIGPGGLNAPEEPALKESNGNRRKSAFIPAVKSILSSNDEDEKKRREARRKSLAKRRVSFAPEATLHTWDVVEYLRDATTSSASSDATRRASNVSQASAQTSPTPESDVEEPPSTPPEQVEAPESDSGSSPANQRDLHQKKHRRRSSGIPPMNFNNPDDVYSSSPSSGDNNEADVESDEEPVTTPEESQPEDPSDNSARLDAALRQATTHAGTQRLNLDDFEDKTMELVEDEVTASFKPWANKNGTPSFQGQENIDPFFPAATSAKDASSDEEGEEMSMDITRAMGRIVTHPETHSSDTDDISMDLTLSIGAIQSSAPKEPIGRRKSLKRRVSLLESSQGSPAKRPTSRRTSLRQQRNLPEEQSSPVDATMDFTIAIGGITSAQDLGDEPATNRRDSNVTSIGDETMDFTVAMGSIKDLNKSKVETKDEDLDDDEDMSMEFTTAVGGIKSFNKQSITPETLTPAKKESFREVVEASPSRSANKSPKHQNLLDLKPSKPLPSPRKDGTPRRSPARSGQKPNLMTPEAALSQSQRIEDFEPSPFVRSASQSVSKPASSISTPDNGNQKVARIEVLEDPITAPILNRRRSSLSSVQFSPLAAARDEPTLRSTAILSNNIKLLSTPRKQALASPVKRAITPKKTPVSVKAPTPKQKTPTPKKQTPRRSASPQKRVNFNPEPEVDHSVEDASIHESEHDVERISLQDFLDMTKIRFMDLNTTKRRHTAAPAAFHDKEIEEREDSLDRYVVAAACTLPEFELFQHACHEMKKYISDGRHFVRSLETNVLEENPLLFSEYLTAPPDQRVVMDNQFKNLKTSARLEARGEWYGWRSSLLHDLKAGLLGTMEGFSRDESKLTDQEALLDAVLPPLITKHERLEAECKQLQQRHDELNGCDREELEQTREQLLAADDEIAQKRRLLAQLQKELADKELRIEAIRERKLECVEEIKAAERVREESRGWSTTEVNDLRRKVTALERAHGWSITSASASGITMTHMNDLELYFQPSAFATGKNTPNGSISLTYVGDTATPRSRPFTTSKRFFLQLIRAHLHCIPQWQTRITNLLSLVKNCWATALAVAEGVRWLEHNHITDETILSDERMAISSSMLLPTLQTKVRVTFEIGINIGAEGVQTEVEPKAELVYGEKYKVKSMCDFLNNFCGNTVKDEKDMTVWADGVSDLAARLKATGRKGERT
ncbi:Spc7 kinetochore protein-domain-containing protein [Dendryphion nanum]|uniref:Spc7 kinetochore protein-domain-containing protein n=1 Tax=Dendryphion nanum TaxID=256645 RepID=A0A9P9INH2_9PLEO|nr:Spc7 kinetochore protein-domain-containing protein [Dendryphion nanum]